MQIDHLPEIYLLAMKATIEATEVILPVYEQVIESETKSDGSPVTKADLASSKVISDILEQTGIPILGEELEKADYTVRSQWKENWCVDPLDGTKMFLLKNDEFSINIAHVKNCEAVFGIISSPIQREMIIGGRGFGAYFVRFSEIDSPEKWVKLTPHTLTNDPLVVTCSRSFFEDQEKRLKENVELGQHKLSYLRKGSALKFFDLVTGRADIYPRFAPTMEWDIAAGHAILKELGGTINDLANDRPLTYNKESLFNPHFIAKTKALLS